MSGLTFVDTNILIDASDAGSIWHAWAIAHLVDAVAAGPLVTNAIVFAEFSVTFGRIEDVATAFEAYRFEDIPREAAFLAGRVHAAYRRRGGGREAILPDFLIGAHCAVRGHRLLTRDGRRYRHAFPSLRVIAPAS
jgi:predicted nucleic acid-binding protein